MWKDKVRRVLDGSSLVNRYRRAQDDKLVAAWDGKVPVPHPIKSRRVINVAYQYGAMTLIETGTCLGDMIQATIDSFRRVHSIELSPLYAARCRDRFSNRPHVKLYEGDSATCLPMIMDSVKERAVIWLDAHWSGGATAMGEQKSPIFHELQTISAHRQHCILIDDAHEFVGRDGYPTIVEMQAIADLAFPQHEMSVKNNIIEILPRTHTQSAQRPR